MAEIPPRSPPEYALPEDTTQCSHLAHYVHTYYAQDPKPRQPFPDTLEELSPSAHERAMERRTSPSLRTHVTHHQIARQYQRHQKALQKLTDLLAAATEEARTRTPSGLAPSIHHSHWHTAWVLIIGVLLGSGAYHLYDRMGL